MKIAIVLNVDRHYDPQVSLYSTPELAIEAAKLTARLDVALATRESE